MTQTNNPTQSPVNPQFQMGATASEAKLVQQSIRSPLGGPGEIVARLGQQFQIPRAEQDASMSRDHSTPYG